MIYRNLRYNPKTDIPEDQILKGQTRKGTPYWKGTENDIRTAHSNPNGMAFVIAKFLAKIRDNTGLTSAVDTIDLGNIARSVTVNPIQTYFGTAGRQPVDIVNSGQSKFPRAYTFVNSGIVSPANGQAQSNEVTLFPSLLRGAAVYNSELMDISQYRAMMFILEVTANAGGGTLVVDVQTANPLTGTFGGFPTTTQETNIFTGSAAIGVYGSNRLEGLGKGIRLQATVAVAAVTFSIVAIGLDQHINPSGSAIFIGGPNVNPNVGFQLLPNMPHTAFIREGVSLFAITDNTPLLLNIFQRQ